MEKKNSDNNATTTTTEGLSLWNTRTSHSRVCATRRQTNMTIHFQSGKKRIKMLSKRIYEREKNTLSNR
jgi:hypothetical protein